MPDIELNPGQSIEYYEDGKLVAKIDSENIEQLSPITRGYVAFVHPYDTKGMFTIPVIGISGRYDFRLIGTIKSRERQGNSLLFIIETRVSDEYEKGKIVQKTVRIDYKGISLDDMFKQKNGKVTETD